MTGAARIFKSGVVLIFCLMLSGTFVSGAPIGGAVAAEAEQSPRQRIERLNAVLLDVMQNADSWGYTGRFDRLNPLLNELFDFKLMGRVAVGAYWKSLDDAQRETLVESFGQLSIASFAARFDGYSGETFEIVSAEKSVRDTILVKTRLIKSNGEPVALNYLTRKSGEAWRIIDIFLDARFSELARLRADYTSVMRREGYDALINTIKARISDLAKPENG